MLVAKLIGRAHPRLANVWVGLWSHGLPRQNFIALSTAKADYVAASSLCAFTLDATNPKGLWAYHIKGAPLM